MAGANDPMTEQLDRALFSGMAWTALMRWSSQLVSWVATFYVARILLPADYGVAALATVAIGYARMVEDFGLDSIFIQDRTIGGEQLARLAGLLLLLGTFFLVLFQAIAQPVATFFKAPQVAWAISLLSILFISDALQIIPRAMLQRDLAFGKLAIVAFLQVLVTQTVLVMAARAGLGFKSLVFNSLAGALTATALLLYWRPLKVMWPRDIARLARPLLQGWRMLVARAGYYFYTTADQLVLGRLLGKDAVGTYSFAQTLSTTAIQEVGSVVSKVVPGIFSAAQQQRAELRRYFLLLTELVVFLTLPMSVGLALTADMVVNLVLGPNWGAVVWPLRILCAYTAFSNAQLLVSHVMLWTGQFRAQMWCTIPTVVMLPPAFYLGAKYGVSGVALGWAIIFPLSTLPAMVIGFRTISIGVSDWLAALRPAAISCVVMTVAVLSVRELVSATHSPTSACLICVGTGAIAYLAGVGLLFRSRVMVLFGLLGGMRRKAA
jgi:O-antigen/teichoic acid export membrane protein